MKKHAFVMLVILRKPEIVTYAFPKPTDFKIRQKSSQKGAKDDFYINFNRIWFFEK